MIAQWTGDVVGEMHVAGVSMKRLAEELGWNVKYLSAVLNCRREPKDAEQKVRRALAVVVDSIAQAESRNRDYGKAART